MRTKLAVFVSMGVLSACIIFVLLNYDHISQLNVSNVGPESKRDSRAEAITIFAPREIKETKRNEGEQIKRGSSGVKLKINDLPEEYQQKVDAAMKFAKSIPELEKQLLEENPLLSDANRIQQELKTAHLSMAKEKELWREWLEEDPRNPSLRVARAAVLELDSIQALLDDPNFGRFLEDSIARGFGDEISLEYLNRFGNRFGLSVEGVELVSSDVETLEEFRDAFIRFGNDIKAIPENAISLNPLPGPYDEYLRNDVDILRRRWTVDFYKMTVLPDDYKKTHKVHSRALRELIHNFGESSPSELDEIYNSLHYGNNIVPKEPD